MEVDVVAEVREQEETLPEGYCELNQAFDKAFSQPFSSITALSE